MREPADLARELYKILDTIGVAHKHFRAESKMNAALHMSVTVRPSPLSIAIEGAAYDLERIINELESVEAVK